MAHTTHALRVLLVELAGFQNVVGIELLNEPHPGSHGHQKLKDWYTSTIAEHRSIDPGIPIYISDCWQTDDYAGYISALPQRDAITAVDHHLYRCFTAYDTHTPIFQHTRALTDSNAETPQLFARVSSKLESCSSGIVVGEWSGAMNPGSLQGLSPEQELTARRGFIDAQLTLYERYCAGWFFWTYKKEQRGDKGWSLRDAVEAGVFPNLVGRRVNLPCLGREDEIRARMEPAKDKALGTLFTLTGNDLDIPAKILMNSLISIGEHTSHWSQYSGNYEHWRFADGFTQGWTDAYKFFGSSSFGRELQHPDS